MKATHEQKRRGVFDYLQKMNHSELASMALSLMFKKDIEALYREINQS